MWLKQVVLSSRRIIWFKFTGSLYGIVRLYFYLAESPGNASDFKQDAYFIGGRSYAGAKGPVGGFEGLSALAIIDAGGI